MLRTLQNDQVAAFDSSDWDQARFEQWMGVDEIGALLSLHLTDHPKARLLDLGGGAGRFADTLLTRYSSCQVVVGDSSELLLSRNQPHPRKKLLRLDASRVDEAFESGSVDVIFMHRLLHHLVGDSYSESIGLIQKVLGQCAAALKPDGRLSIIENIWDGRLVDRLSGRLLYHATSSRLLAPLTRRMGANTAGTGVCYLSDQLLRDLLQDAGFHVASQQVFGDLNFPRYIRYPLLLKRARSVHYWCQLQ